jgi:gluconokinase
VILIVAGVAGCGKSTVGAMLAGRLRWRFADADTFHPEANIAKMREGIPLTDEDRRPWLRAVTDWIDASIAEGQSAVITCSALRRAYRAELLDRRPAATMVFLQVSRDVLDRRLLARRGHFFPEKLLDSQLAALEPPTPDEERVVTVLAEGDPAQTAAKIIATLWPYGDPGQGDAPVPSVLLRLAGGIPGRPSVAWTGETQAGLARHLQLGPRDREGAEGEVRRGRGQEGAGHRDHPRQGVGPAEEARAQVPRAQGHQAALPPGGERLEELRPPLRPLSLEITASVCEFTHQLMIYLCKFHRIATN